MENTTQDVLFATGQDAPVQSPATVPLPAAKPRLRLADRAQVLIRPCSLEELVGPEHPVRIVWALIDRWDLSLFLATIAARGEASGRDFPQSRTKRL